MCGRRGATRPCARDGCCPFCDHDWFGRIILGRKLCGISSPGADRAIGSGLLPPEYLDIPLRDSGVICFSASGKNKDIGAAFEEAALREVRPLIALVMREASPLHDLAEKYRYSRLISAPSSHFKDGFLAVGSLIGACSLLVRGYRALLGADDLPVSLEKLVEVVAGVGLDDIVEASIPALTPSTTSILFTASLKPAAVDIESRFVEAALGNVHGTDLRNFGHGRHHWFAKHARDTGIVALIGDDRELRTERSRCCQKLHRAFVSIFADRRTFRVLSVWRLAFI